MPDFSDFIRNLLVGEPFGEVYPPRAAPPPPALDGRTAALKILRRYLSELTFNRPGDKPGEWIGFQIPEKRIFIEWPDHEDEIKDLPIIGLISGGPFQLESVGMGSWIYENTWDKSKRTALQVQSNYVETLFVDVLTATKQQRRAMLQGIITALSPTEFMYGIRFRMPEYYDEVVTFSPQQGTIIEEEDGARGRRMARIEVQMYFHILAEVPVEPMTPEITTLVDFNPDDPGSPDKIALDVTDTDPVGDEADPLDVGTDPTANQ